MKIKPMTLVRLNPNSKDLPFSTGKTYLFLGEIEKMPGHCAVADRTGKVFFPYHTDDFIPLTENEI